MSKSISFILALCFIFLLFSCSSPKPESAYSIIPQPSSIIPASGWVQWKNRVTIKAASDEEQKIAVLISDFLLSQDISSSITKETQSDEVQIVLALSPAQNPNDEAYQLIADAHGVHITASHGAGLFYGAQTLFQLFTRTEKSIRVPFISISDVPRFLYRGLHLDVGRHFLPVYFVKRYIDLMAHYKLNTFHWHLTEDQGWRIEIKKYPKLQELAAYRKETVIGHASTRTRNEPHDFDGMRHGGYYTQEQIKEVVAYAADHYITVIPEIELPGHALAALAAYPHLGCTGGPYEVATTWGIFNDVFCAGKETTFQFLEDVLDEVIPLFPGKYIHIGGDECFKDSWEKCAHCQKRIKNEKLKDEHELQSYFIQRVEKYINSKGKRIIGWDEILEGGLAPDATVMSWRGEEGGIAAAQQNHDVIMTPSQWLYFDYMQDSSATEPLAVKVLVDVKTVYSYDPVPEQFTSEQAKHILGLQANVWTEYMKTGDNVEYMVYPRALALAEVGWSQKEDRSYNDFVRRIKAQQPLLDLWKVNYARHIFQIDTLE